MYICHRITCIGPLEVKVKVLKRNEIKNRTDYEMFEEVKDEGQPTLGLNWVLVEKVIEGTSGVKA